MGTISGDVGELYTNTTEQGGRINIDVVLMIKLLALQLMYGLSDPELERKANDKISFLRFLGFPKKVPDQTTVWYFRERLSKTKKDKAIWKELQRQLEGKGLKIRKGVIQDATFITADPGNASADTPWNVFHYAHTHVTTFIRAHVKMMCAAFSFNLIQLVTLKKQGFI